MCLLVLIELVLYARQVARRLHILQPIALLIPQCIEIESVKCAYLVTYRGQPDCNNKETRTETEELTLIPYPSNLGLVESRKSIPMLVPHLEQNSWSFFLVLKRYTEQRERESPCHLTSWRWGSVQASQPSVYTRIQVVVISLSICDLV